MNKRQNHRHISSIEYRVYRILNLVGQHSQLNTGVRDKLLLKGCGTSNGRNYANFVIAYVSDYYHHFI